MTNLNNDQKSLNEFLTETEGEQQVKNYRDAIVDLLEVATMSENNKTTVASNSLFYAMRLLQEMQA